MRLPKYYNLLIVNNKDFFADIKQFAEISSKNHILFVLNELHRFKENLLAPISYVENQRPPSTRHILCLVFSMLEKNRIWGTS